MATALDASSVAALLGRREQANLPFFEQNASQLAALCHSMAERFARGGRLIACGISPAARSDVRHVAVEFVHPVIVGKRALPAIGIASERECVVRDVELVTRPADMLIAFGADHISASDSDALGAATSSARRLGASTLAFGDAGAEFHFDVPAADPFVRQEIIETLYHVLWELVHVFFEHRGLLEGRAVRPTSDAGGSSFLYPFLAEQENNVDIVLEDVRRSIIMKAEEIDLLRAETVALAGARLEEVARAVRNALNAGGTLYAFGNGGSATDAMDLVADLRSAPQGWRACRAVDLTEDPAILSAIANDVGPDSIFARQIIAYGREGDVAVAFSTSGNSGNVIRALTEARRQGMLTIAFAGYDGGRIAAEALADVVVISPSQHIPRVQEAQATGYHLMRELMETPF